MKKSLKKIISLALTSAMALTSMAMSVYAQENAEIPDAINTTNFDHVVLTDENGTEIIPTTISEPISEETMTQNDIQTRGINNCAYPRTITSIPYGVDKNGNVVEFPKYKETRRDGTLYHQAFFGYVSPTQMQTLNQKLAQKGYTLSHWETSITFKVEGDRPVAMVLSKNNGEQNSYPITRPGTYTLSNIITPVPEDPSSVYTTQLSGYFKFYYPTTGRPGTSMFSAIMTYNYAKP